MKIANVRANSWSRLVAWVVGGLFVAGFFVDPIGTWTGPILGLWFVGTQRVWRGFLWMLAFAFIPSILMEWRRFPIAGLEAAGAYLAWTFLAAVLSVLPFSFHRIVSPRLKGLLSTLPLPLAVVVLHILAGPRLHVEMTSRSGVCGVDVEQRVSCRADWPRSGSFCGHLRSLRRRPGLFTF